MSSSRQSQRPSSEKERVLVFKAESRAPKLREHLLALAPMGRGDHEAGGRGSGPKTSSGSPPSRVSGRRRHAAPQPRPSEQLWPLQWARATKAQKRNEGTNQDLSTGPDAPGAQGSANEGPAEAGARIRTR